MITRYQDWPERLAQYLRAEAPKPYAWGTADCVTLAAGAIEAMTGVDVIADVRGTWNDEASAFVAIYKLGVTLDGAVSAVLLPQGAVEITNFKLLQRGDIVIVTQKETRACGVVSGSLVASRGTSKLAWLRLSSVSRAWRI